MSRPSPIHLGPELVSAQPTASSDTGGADAAAFSVDDICYEGCFTAPPSDPWAVPLPQPLARGPRGAPMPLLNCRRLAWAAGLQYFAIVDEIDCYGGNATVSGWAADDACDLECVPGGGWPFSCGGNRRASLFSLGKCAFGDEPCPSTPLVPELLGLPTLPPSQPPAPPPQPRLPPAPKSFRCRDGGIALWGAELPRVKLNLKNSRTNNTELCQRLCSANPACQGFYFKTDNYCHQFSQVYSFTGTRYRSVVRACKTVLTASG